jgi:hypothetical protein
MVHGLLLSGITLVALAPMASAYPDPPAPGGTGVPIQTPPPVVESAAGSGLPTWAVLLIATGAAILAVAVTLFAVALRYTRHSGQPTPA